MTSFWQIVGSTFSLHDSVNGLITVDIAFLQLFILSTFSATFDSAKVAQNRGAVAPTRYSFLTKTQHGLTWSLLAKVRLSLP